jgi:ankyrin repeat protein
MDDIYPIYSLFRDQSVFDELFQLAVRGGTTELESRLGELENAMEYLTTFRWDGEEQLTLMMVAALHGHDETVRLLLTCDPLAEQVKLRGRLLNENQTIMGGVNALYCACYRGHFHVVKTLIELGKADVNETTSDYRTFPLLLHATINNHLDIVRFLVENRYADVNETKSEGHCPFTALMCAAEYGHVCSDGTGDRHRGRSPRSIYASPSSRRDNGSFITNSGCEK